MPPASEREYLPSLPIFSRRTLIVIFLFVVAFYLFGLGKMPLVGPDEPRYAEVAREMLMRRDFVTPMLGHHTWFEKPALLYWMMIASFRVFGVTEYAARLGPAICGVLTVLGVWFICNRVESRSNSETGHITFFSCLVTATSLGLIAFSRAASFDIVITMTTTWSLALFFDWELADEARGKSSLVGFYTLMGLSLLAKGLIGVVIPLGVVFVYFALRRRWPRRYFLFSLLWGIPLACIVSSIWYGPVIAHNGWRFVDEFFIQHHFARYISNKYHHPQPVYFYVLILILLTLPWTLFLVDSLIGARQWSWRDDDVLSKARVFALAWLVMPLLFFSFSGSKLPGYILPVLPAAALLIGERLSTSISSWARYGSSLLCVLIGVIFVGYAMRTAEVSVSCAFAVALPFFAAGVVLLLLKIDTPQTVLAVAACVIAALCVALNCGAARLARHESVKDLLTQAQQHGYGSEPVFIGEGSVRTAEFYAADRVVYASSGEPVSLEDVGDMLAESRRRNSAILVFVPMDQAPIVARQRGVELIGDNGSVTLFRIAPV